MKKIILLTLLFMLCRTVFSQETAQPGVTEAIYKTVGATKLKLYIYQPQNHDKGERIPAIIFFHGGAWCEGHAWQFFPQCKFLATKGMVSISAEYRVRKRQKNTTPFDCVADAKSAIRWVRTHAAEYGIDTNRIVAGGGSAGGHMAACTALINGFDEIVEDASISSIPNALVLFNPPLDVPEVVNNLPKDLRDILEKRGIEISPVHHVKEGAPPTIIFHGTEDSAVPFHQSINFSEEMKKHNNRCEVEPFEGREHGFFNYYKGKNPDFQTTMDATVKFLVSIGYLK